MTLSKFFPGTGATLASSVTASLLLVSPALAHVTLESPEAAAGATYRAVVRVPHGCDGEATQELHVTLPEGFYAAKPMPKAGWQLETVTGAYATPYMNHGTEMTEGLREIVWSGGNLQDDWYDEFVFRGTVGPNMAPGSVLSFPVVQVCASGTADWSDTSGAAGVPNPAPSVTVTSAAIGGHEHGEMAGMAAMDEPVTLGALKIAAPFIRATLPNQPVGGGFVSIENTGEAADRLIGATAEVAGKVEVHQMEMQGDVMKMRELADGLEIPAGETVTLTPGGLHIMFMDLHAGLEEGQSIPVTLEFETAGKVQVIFPVRARDAVADMPAHQH
ncbi:DUF1775 domain-containing protein [Puniceibacterium sp. HSS470]|jgi:uncharacterized protein YcnI/copper(I)-binding protein|nr:DUF1775 domain-containing protein [Puniceibacterium sp. HSS470]|tara:strand:+ start:62091 stop:63083 length:993 start_codon:yes stop_codon:yes gene_type:complete